MRKVLVTRQPRNNGCKFPYWQGFLKHTYYSHFKFYKKLKKKKEYTLKDEILESLENCNVDKRENFWETFKKLDMNKHSESDNIDSTTWFSYYKSLNESNYVASQEKVDILKVNERQNADNHNLDQNISIQEIKNHISKLKLKKMVGQI